MSTITKEQLLERAREKVKGLEYALKHPVAFADTLTELEEELELARIALASLEAEPVGYFGRFYADDEDLIDQCSRNISGAFPLYTAPPAPVFPRDLEEIIFTIVNAMADEKLRNDESELFSLARKYIEHAKSKLSAAMLKGAEPVKTAYKLPDDFDFDRFNDVVWLEAVASNPHMHSLTTSTIAMVALELNKHMNVANSPVIADGWVACSERMPDIGTEIFYFCRDDGLRDCGIVSSSNFSGRGDAQLYVHAEGYDLRLGVDITHWMPLPAKPNREVL